ncbi:MAG: hypothetical protein ABR613_08220 [Actinomycetota bacterium]
MARVHVEEVLRDLDRPLDPRPEFAEALLAMLEMELADGAAVESSPAPRREQRPRSVLLRRTALAGGLTVALAIVALLVGTLPGGSPSALAVVQDAREKFAEIPPFRATVIQRTPGEAIAEEERLERAPDLVVQREVAYQDDAHFRVEVVSSSWDGKTGAWNDHRESGGSFTVADGTYLADYGAFQNELSVGRLEDEDISAIRFRATALLDPDLHEFGDYSDAYFEEHCKLLPDDTIAGRRARHIQCQEDIDTDIWVDAEWGFVLRYESDGVTVDGEPIGRLTWLEVTSISYGTTFDPSEFEIVTPDGARVLWVGGPPIPERFQVEGDPRVSATIDVRGLGGPVLFANDAVWTNGIEGGQGQSLTGGIGYVARIDPATNEVVSRAPLVPVVDEMPKGYTGLLIDVDDAAADDRSLWVSEYHAGREWTRKFRLWRLDLVTGQFVGDPLRLPGQSAGLVATDDGVFAMLSSTRTVVVGPAELQFGGLARIDPTTGEKQIVEYQGNPDFSGKHTITADGDHVYLPWWFPDLENPREPGRNVILKIDQHTLKVVDTFDLPVEPYTHVGLHVAGDKGHLWVAFGNEEAGTLLKLDAHNGRVIDRLQVGRALTDVDVGEGLLWVCDSKTDSVLAVDPSTMKVTEKIRTGSLPISIAVGARAVWVKHSSDGSVVRIDL